MPYSSGISNSRGFSIPYKIVRLHPDPKPEPSAVADGHPGGNQMKMFADSKRRVWAFRSCNEAGWARDFRKSRNSGLMPTGDAENANSNSHSITAGPSSPHVSSEASGVVAV